MVSGEGGGVYCVVGQEGPFHAGVLRRRSTTLLEAILSVTADRVYERVVVFTGIGEQLPSELSVAVNMRVGREACGWYLRGSTETSSSSGSIYEDAIGRVLAMPRTA